MLDYEVTGSVAVVTIDRPERRNAIDRATAESLRDAVTDFEGGDADVLVLTGADGTFSAGADMQAMDLEDGEDGWLGISRVRTEKPTVAAIEGHCVGGGLELALWCDLRVAGESATFGCLERRHGVPLVDGATQRLPAVVGLGRALDLILTGREIDAERARDWGLLSRVVEDGEARSAAVDLAETLASFPQATLRTDRQAVYDGIGATLQQGLTMEAWHGTRVLEQAREGAAAFRGDENR